MVVRGVSVPAAGTGRPTQVAARSARALPMLSAAVAAGDTALSR
jgi:hypothetical protein